MNRVRRTLAAVATTAVAAGMIASTSSGAMASPTPVTAYNAVPTSLPGNVPSQAFQATQTGEFGDLVGLASPGVAADVTVVLSSWGCQSGAWYSNDCVTSSGATFSHPITLNLYKEGAGSTVGPLILSDTETFSIPYRPSADGVNCTGANAGKWYSAADSACYNGFATKVTFNVASQNAALPSHVIWTVAYNTSGYGTSPLGYATACAATAAGCPYDSLNVGAESFAGQPSVGTDLDADGAFLSSVTGGQYCDGGVGGTGSLRNDTGCWTGFRPLATIRTAGSYTFTGFGPPVNNGNVENIANAGQTIPLKFRVTDNGVPVTNITSVSVSVDSLSCAGLGTTADLIEEYASGSSGLINQGDGYYQFNWKTPKTYAKSCKTLMVDVGDGVIHTAIFRFTK